MLLLIVGWLVLACFLALVIGSAIHAGQSEAPAPEGVSPREWERITERHVPHTIPFPRRK